MTLEELILCYKEISSKILKKLQEDQLDELNNLLEERQKIINQLGEKDCTEEELRNLYSRYDLFNLDEIMKREFELKKEELKGKIANSKKRKVANEKYNNLNSRAVFLSREI